jgi:predicted PurR-regulated permease PerM
MSRRTSIAFWAAVAGGALLLLWLLSPMLLPFVAGMAIAYFLDPVADRLERAGMGRTAATALITAVFFIAVIAVLLLIVPVLQSQLAGFLGRLPDYVLALRDLIAPLAERVLGEIDWDQPAAELKRVLAEHRDQALAILRNVASGLLGGGLAVLNLLSLVVITPVVAFYLLRDWDKLIARVDGLLPRPQAETIRAQAREIDRVLAGFARGQASVCLILAAYYGLALSLLGLDFGLVIGIAAGLLSFIPYVGAGLGLIASVGLALIQFGLDYVMVGLVLAVFVVGQAVEGNILTPRLVGAQVGLHPVWIIFGLLAGASLFGFVGMLLAVPVFAVIGVLVRFALQRYQASRLYHGPDGPPAAQP